MTTEPRRVPDERKSSGDLARPGACELATDPCSSGSRARAGERDAPVDRARRVAELGVAVALSTTLSMVTVFRMPLGGSVTPGSMLPLWLVARRHGWRTGLLAGLVHGGVQLALGSTVVHPVQALLDYVLAYAAVGLVGTVRDWPLAVGAVLATGARLGCHALAGVFFFPQVPLGWSVLGYALTYNALFLLPDMGLALGLAAGLRRVRPHLLDPIEDSSHGSGAGKLR